MNELWLLGTAILFTGVGMYINSSNTRADALVMIEKAIDDLVLSGYIKHTKDAKGETTLMKWWEDYPKGVDKSVD